MRRTHPKLSSRACVSAVHSTAVHCRRPSSLWMRSCSRSSWSLDFTAASVNCCDSRRVGGGRVLRIGSEDWQQPSELFCGQTQYLLSDRCFFAMGRRWAVSSESISQLSRVYQDRVPSGSCRVVSRKKIRNRAWFQGVVVVIGCALYQCMHATDKKLGLSQSRRPMRRWYNFIRCTSTRVTSPSSFNRRHLISSKPQRQSLNAATTSTRRT